MTQTLQDLLVPRSHDQLLALLLSDLQSKNFPTTDYVEGTPAHTVLSMFVAGLADREDLPRTIAAGGLWDLASTLKDGAGNPLDAIAETLAEQKYGVTRIPASFSRVSLTLTCTQGAGHYSRAAGELEAISTAGNRYTNATSVTIPDGSSTVAEFIAREPGEVVDSLGAIAELSTPLPGVSVVDALAKFSDVASSWTGSGNIVPSSSSAFPSPSRTIKVTITRDGRIGTGQATIEVYPVGSPVERRTQVLITNSIDVGDVRLTFTDGASDTTSFVAGSTWIISAPGSPTITNGAPAESLSSLRQRCRDRWAGLSRIPTEGRYQAWVRQCSTENAMGINRIATTPSRTTAGQLDVFVADRTGTISVAHLATLQRYMDARTSGPNERASVSMCAGAAVNVTGKAWVKRSRLKEVQDAARAAWKAYLAETAIGGFVRVSKLNQILENAGAFNSESLRINNTTEVDVDLRLPAGSVPLLGNGIDSLEWLEVA